MKSFLQYSTTRLKICVFIFQKQWKTCDYLFTFMSSICTTYKFYKSFHSIFPTQTLQEKNTRALNPPRLSMKCSSSTSFDFLSPDGQHSWNSLFSRMSSLRALTLSYSSKILFDECKLGRDSSSIQLLPACYFTISILHELYGSSTLWNRTIMQSTFANRTDFQILLLSYRAIPYSLFLRTTIFPVPSLLPPFHSRQLYMSIRNS